KSSEQGSKRESLIGSLVHKPRYRAGDELSGFCYASGSLQQVGKASGVALAPRVGATEACSPRGADATPLTTKQRHEEVALMPASTIVGLLALCALADLPSVEQMAASRQDVWGEAAVQQPGGPSYEFFRDLLPPLRYVNTDFRHYPI